MSLVPNAALNLQKRFKWHFLANPLQEFMKKANSVFYPPLENISQRNLQ